MRGLGHLAGFDDGGLLWVLDGAAAGAYCLEGLDDLEGLIISDLTENDVAAIEPRGLDSGNEELRAVGVRAGVGHGQESRAGVLDLEVLIGKLLAVDGLATGAVATGEVTTLEHELGDDAVEGRALITEAVLASAELTEVAGSLGDIVVVEVEDDAARLVLGGGVDNVKFVVEDRALPLNFEEDLGHVDG